jgi:exopolyphosphatase/guanosine-5'-triphosphate,3'-diphosphate pyrophosphatase
LASKYSIPKEIADTLDGYAIILRTLLKLTKNSYIYILETSLPEALLANALFDFELSKANNKTVQLISVATFLCKKFNTDLSHAKQVAKLSETMFLALKDLLGLKDEDLTYLQLAAYLHDIGMFINNRSHHKHSEYIISSLNLFRLTDEELRVIACIARYHRKAPPLRSHFLYNTLSQERQISIQKLSSILKIANALDGSHKQKVKKMDVVITPKQEVVLNVSTLDNFILEKVNFLDKKDLFEEISGSKISLVVKNQS